MIRKVLHGIAALALLLTSLFGLPTQAQEKPREAEKKPTTRAAPVPPESWYAATLAEDEKGNFLMVHFWSRGPLFRSEAVLAGRRIVTIVDTKTYSIVDAVGGAGISIGRSDLARAQDATRGRPFANEVEQLLLQGGELIGSEEVGERTLDVYRITNDRGRRTIWVSTTNPPLPLRVETYDRDSATTGKIDYVNWIQNPYLPLSFFAPDPRWKIEHFAYDEYTRRIRTRPLGPAPVLYRHLLHGQAQPE